MKLTKERREFLLKEFDNISHYRTSFSTMRIGALGASLTILGVIVSVGKNANFPTNSGIFILLLVIVFSSIKIIGAINRGQLVFSTHLRSIEKELKQIGFNTYWGNYLKKNTKDSGSYAFVVATRAINLAISIYIIIGSATNIHPQTGYNFKNTVFVGMIVLTLISIFLNEYNIRKEIEPSGYLDRINNSFEEARTMALKEFESNDEDMLDSDRP